MLVVFEEIGGDPTQISFATKQVGSLCSHVSESHPAPVDMWNTDQTGERLGPMLLLECPSSNHVITSIKFASFGTPQGSCGSYTHGKCSSFQALPLVRKVGNPTFSRNFLCLIIYVLSFLELPYFLQFSVDVFHTLQFSVDVSDL